MPSSRQEQDEPQRTCIVKRSAQPKELLMRFVLSPEGQVVPDLANKLPGRGAWVTANAQILAQAVKRQGFKRAFKGGDNVDQSLVTLVGALLTKDALQSLSLANKAGLVVTGALKTGASVAGGAVTALIHAVEGSPDGLRKLLRPQSGLAETGETNPKIIKLFNSHQLDLALGRTNVIHAALLKGAASDAFLAKCARLSFFAGPGDEVSTENRAER